MLNIDKEPCFISVPFGGSLEIVFQRVLSVTFSLNSPLILKNKNIQLKRTLLLRPKVLGRS